MLPGHHGHGESVGQQGMGQQGMSQQSYGQEPEVSQSL